MKPEAPGNYTALSGEEMDAFTAHCQAVLGESQGVWHELVSETVHLDILPFPPSDIRNAWTFITMGMSALHMKVPEAAEGAPRRIELMITLPHDWSKPQPGSVAVRFDDDEFVPIGAMKRLARYVHEEATWFGHGHTVQWAFPEGHALSAFGGFLISAPAKCPPELASHVRPDGEEVGIFALLPIYHEELAFKQASGADALFKLVNRANLSDIIKPGRPSLLKQQRFWDRFK